MSRLGQMIAAGGVMAASLGVGAGVAWFLHFLLTGIPQL